jgi:peptidoglycan/LPS O-acetylase OafA/YrhL
MRSRFIVLDGLRGLAAIMIVVWHTGATRFVPGAYLAVDLFFALSGFVLSHAYEARDISWPAFMRVRLIRLYPLYILGTCLGGATLLMHVPADGRYWGAAATALFMLPSPSAWGPYAPFPLDIPAWSLFFELLVNAAWFALLPRLSNRALAAVLAVAAIALMAIVLVKHSLQVGSADADFLFWGCLRTAYSFFAGVACYRLWRRFGTSVPAAPSWLILALLLAAIAVPGNRAVIDGAAALVLFPAIVFLGACSQTKGRLGFIYALLGAVSYAVYTLHAPLLDLLRVGVDALHITARHVDYLLAAITPLLVIAIAYGADLFYDQPVRAFLARRVRAFGGRATTAAEQAHAMPPPLPAEEPAP